MDILYQSSQCTAQQVLERMAEPPSYSAVRALLRLLEERGHVKHKKNGARYVYLPAVPRATARRRALDHVVSTFFEGSIEQAMLTLVESSRHKLSEAELDRLAALVEKAKQEGK